MPGDSLGSRATASIDARTEHAIDVARATVPAVARELDFATISGIVVTVGASCIADGGLGAGVRLIGHARAGVAVLRFTTSGRDGGHDGNQGDGTSGER
jgi:hypothetical protein